MNEANKKSVWRFIQKHGNFLKDKLKPHPNHPNGRNPYAHICLLIKNLVAHTRILVMKRWSS